HPKAPPTTTSEGKCWRPVTRLTLTAAAAPYTSTCDNGPGYSCAITEADVQASMECMEGNDALLLASVKNLPCPPTGNGLCRAKISFSASLTARLLISASPESNPVSRCRARPVQLP